jgi:hypothetical protein
MCVRWTLVGEVLVEEGDDIVRGVEDAAGLGFEVDRRVDAELVPELREELDRVAEVEARDLGAIRVGVGGFPPPDRERGHRAARLRRVEFVHETDAARCVRGAVDTCPVRLVDRVLDDGLVKVVEGKSVAGDGLEAQRVERRPESGDASAPFPETEFHEGRRGADGLPEPRRRGGDPEADAELLARADPAANLGGVRLELFGDRVER